MEQSMAHDAAIPEDSHKLSNKIEKSHFKQIWGFHKWGYPPIIYFSGFSLTKTNHFGYPHLWKPPYKLLFHLFDGYYSLKSCLFSHARRWWDDGHNKQPRELWDANLAVMIILQIASCSAWNHFFWSPSLQSESSLVSTLWYLCPLEECDGLEFCAIGVACPLV